MKIVNAIKKLKKNGYKVTSDKSRYTATKEGERHYIELMSQISYEGEEEVIIIDVRREGQADDSMTDYHAGTFCDNLSQALAIANN